MEIKHIPLTMYKNNSGLIAKNEMKFTNQTTVINGIVSA